MKTYEIKTLKDMLEKIPLEKSVNWIDDNKKNVNIKIGV